MQQSFKNSSVRLASLLLLIASQTETSINLREQGCKVTAHDLRSNPLQRSSNLFTVNGDISDEESIESCIKQAREHFGPIHILTANAGITDESNHYPIWEMPTKLWEKTYGINVRGTFLTLKYFLKSAEISQKELGKELENLAVVITGSECGKFGQAMHSDYASGKVCLKGPPSGSRILPRRPLLSDTCLGWFAIWLGQERQE